MFVERLNVQIDFQQINTSPISFHNTTIALLSYSNSFTSHFLESHLYQVSRAKNSAANSTFGAHILRLLYSCHTPRQEFVGSVPSLPGLKKGIPKQKKWRISDWTTRKMGETNTYEDKKWSMFKKKHTNCGVVKKKNYKSLLTLKFSPVLFQWRFPSGLQISVTWMRTPTGEFLDIIERRFTPRKPRTGGVSNMPGFRQEPIPTTQRPSTFRKKHAMKIQQMCFSVLKGPILSKKSLSFPVKSTKAQTLRIGDLR